MENKDILISGAGIAGLTLAYWLRTYGYHPVVIEHWPGIREGGYVVDLFGAGFDVAEKMGIIEDVGNQDVKIPEIVFMDGSNKRIGGFDAFKIRELLQYRACTLSRGSLAKILYEHLYRDVEIIFGRSITKIIQNQKDVAVLLNDGTTRFFDLLVGADGLHSNVRKQVFGMESLFEKYYGYYTASFTIENYLQNNNLFLSHTVPGKQVSIYSLKENKLAAFFLFTSARKIACEPHVTETQKQILRKEFSNVGWECPFLLAKSDSSDDFYFDAVSQIRMKDWAQDRVVLVGDACSCPSLLSGQSVNLAMVGAYILAGELKAANGNYKMAFQQYQNIFKPFMNAKQKITQGFAGSFLPSSKTSLWMRNAYNNLMILPVVSARFIRQFVSDRIELREY